MKLGLQICLKTEMNLTNWRHILKNNRMLFNREKYNLLKDR